MNLPQTPEEADRRREELAETKAELEHRISAAMNEYAVLFGDVKLKEFLKAI